MFCLVCFDIVEDRSRTRVVKVLKSHGQRVQKSVFECGVNMKPLLTLYGPQGKFVLKRGNAGFQFKPLKL